MNQLDLRYFHIKYRFSNDQVPQNVSIKFFESNNNDNENGIIYIIIEKIMQPMSKEKYNVQIFHMNQNLKQRKNDINQFNNQFKYHYMLYDNKSSI